MKLNGSIRKEIVSSVREALMAGFKSAVPASSERGITSSEYLSRQAAEVREKQAFKAGVNDTCSKIRICLDMFRTADDLEDQWPEIARHLPEWINNPRGYFNVPAPIRR